MSRNVKIAAIQMDANPAPTGERLERSERLVAVHSRLPARAATDVGARYGAG